MNLRILRNISEEQLTHLLNQRQVNKYNQQNQTGTHKSESNVSKDKK